MKQLLILLLLNITLFSANIDKYAKENNFYRDYKTALTQAQKEKKPLMMVLGADYCPWCRKFERATLSKKKIDAMVHKSYIPLILNRETDEFPDIFKTPIIPVVFFVDYRDEDGFWESRGYIKKKDFVEVVIED